jgi:hypothetical protein
MDCQASGGRISPPTCYQPATPPFQVDSSSSSSPATSSYSTSYLTTSPSSCRSFCSPGFSFSSPDRLSYHHQNQADESAERRCAESSSLSCLSYASPDAIQLPALEGQLTARVPSSPISASWQYHVRDYFQNDFCFANMSVLHEKNVGIK